MRKIKVIGLFIIFNFSIIGDTVLYVLGVQRRG